MPQHTKAEQEKASIARLTAEFAAIKGQGTGSGSVDTRSPENVTTPQTPPDSAIFRAPEAGQGPSAPSITSQREDTNLGEELSGDQSSFLEDFLPRAAVFMAGVLTGAPGQELAGGLGMLGQMSVAQREREQQEVANEQAASELEVRRSTAEAQATETQRANVAREATEATRVGIYGALSENQIATARQDTIRNDAKYYETLKQNEHLRTGKTLDRDFEAAAELERLRQARERLGFEEMRIAVAENQLKAGSTSNERLKIAVLKMYTDAQAWSADPVDFNTWAQSLPANILEAFKLEKLKPGGMSKPPEVEQSAWDRLFGSKEEFPHANRQIREGTMEPGEKKLFGGKWYSAEPDGTGVLRLQPIIQSKAAAAVPTVGEPLDVPGDPDDVRAGSAAAETAMKQAEIDVAKQLAFARTEAELDNAFAYNMRIWSDFQADPGYAKRFQALYDAQRRKFFPDASARPQGE